MPHRATVKIDTYTCFADLQSHEVRGKDYGLDVRCQSGARVAVIAPHGGEIEPETAKIAEAIAGTEFSPVGRNNQRVLRRMSFGRTWMMCISIR